MAAPQTEGGRRRLVPNRQLGLALLVLVVWSAVAATAFAQSPSTGPHAGAGEGGVLRIGVVESRLGGIDLYAADPAVDSLQRLFRCCLARTLLAYPGLPTEEGGTVLRPDLAAGPPTVSADGLVWSFEIRPGVRYQPPFDDRTVVAADIVRAIERNIRVSPELTDPGWPFHGLVGAAAYARGEATVISGLQSSDPLSLSFRLTSPDGAFGHYLTDPSTAPIPDGAADGYDPVVPSFDPMEPDFIPPPEIPFGPRFVSSGAYMFEPYPADPSDGRVTLVRNPSWDPATDELRRPSLERIEFTLVPSLEEAWAMLERGDIDMMDRPADADRLARYQADPGLADRLHTTSSETIGFIPLNLAVPPFDDLAVRRAVNAAVDRAALKDAFVEGRSELPFLNGVRQDFEVADHVFADSLTAGLLVTYDPYPSSGHRGDVSAARAEMRRSRYDGDQDGLCDAPACGGVVIVAEYPRVGEILREGFATIGIEAQVVAADDENDMAIPSNRTAVQVPWFQVGYGMHGGDLAELLRGGVALSADEPGFNLSLVGATPEQLAAWGYQVTQVPGVDDLIDRCQRETGHRRARCWAELDQVVSEAIVPWIPVYAGSSAWLVSPRVQATKLDQTAFANFPALERTVVTDGPGS